MKLADAHREEALAKAMPWPHSFFYNSSAATAPTSSCLCGAHAFRCVHAVCMLLELVPVLNSPAGAATRWQGTPKFEHVDLNRAQVSSPMTNGGVLESLVPPDQQGYDRAVGMVVA